MKVDRLTTVEVEHMPDPSEMVDGILYVSRRFELAIHLCACGCGYQTVTPIDKVHPCWELRDDQTGPTLRPSIGNQHWPCGSHYWVTDGRIEPC